MAGILDGIRVIDWSHFHVGPYAAAILGDLGADVIHVEIPGEGDPLRGIRTLVGRPTTLPSGRNFVFEEINRNKRSLAIDLKTPRGREIIYRLCKSSDVFLTNYRPHARTALGMDAETIRAHNPNLVYAAATAFGERGPDRDRPSLDLVAQARSGTMWGSGDQGMPPVQITPGIADRIASLDLSFGVVAALFARERLGTGQEVAVSQLGSNIRLQGYTALMELVQGGTYRSSRDDAPNPLYNFYRCQDGVWIALALLETARYWPAFCQAIDRTDLPLDPRFETWQGRATHNKELIAVFDEVFASKPFEAWSPALEKADIIFSRVNEFRDLARDPQAIANDYVVEWDHPVEGRVKFLGFPIEFSETPQALRLAAPELGQHTEEILIDLCGYDWDAVGELQRAGVV